LERSDDFSQTKPLEALGNLYYILGRYPEAESLFLRVVSIREKALGRDHPETAKAWYCLAELYLSEKRYGRARQLATQAIPVLQRALGRE
jgi:tetratricopeptide (TPR) repeat protein